MLSMMNDEAFITMNAKDIVLFGVKSLENDRLYILWSGNLLLLLILFSIFEVLYVTLQFLF